MKDFEQARMILFDSTMASFRLSVEANFKRPRQDGSLSNLVYVTNRGNAQLNPNIYLVFTYKGDTFESSKNLYTSYPQLFFIREQMDNVKDALVKNKGFVDVEGVLTVHPDYQSPFTVGNIGKQNRWISFSVVAMDSGEKDIMKKVPGVSLQISDSEYVSVLTAEEFLTLYTIIKDMDLAGMALQMSALFLQFEGDNQYVQPVYQQPAPQPQYQQQYQPRQPQNQGGYQSRQPQYNQRPMQQTSQPQVAPQPQYQQPAPQPQYQQPAPQPQYQPRQPQGSALPPRREEKQIVNMNAIESTPISQVNFDDEDAINSIFDDE
jgi:hypothetical protein